MKCCVNHRAIAAVNYSIMTLVAPEVKTVEPGTGVVDVRTVAFAVHRRRRSSIIAMTANTSGKPVAVTPGR
jgi:hypothetical protein